MTYHALCYKHRCRGAPDAKRKRRLEQLDARIEKRLGLGELVQRAGEDERIEQQAGGEDRIEQPAGEDERIEQRAVGEERIEQQAGQEAAPLEEEAVGLAAFAQA